jgi:hypothetical protein
MAIWKDAEAADKALAVLQTFVQRGAPAPEAVTHVHLNPVRYVLVHLAAAVTGYTEAAIRRKIHEGVWREGREWVRAPDERILIDLEGVTKWVVEERSR